MANAGNSNPGNFANDRDKAAKAGQKGGQASSADREKTTTASKKSSTPNNSSGRH